MEFIGHRGCAAQHPENTVEALTSSAQVLDTVEVDVRRCATGELVGFHDERVDRLTGASGPLSSFSWSELSELEVLDSGEPIPRLSAALAAVPDDVRVQVELKERGLADDVRAVVSDHDPEVAVSSFDPGALATVEALDWPVETGFLFGADPVDSLERAVDLGCDAVHPHYDLCLETDVVESAHRAGLRVVAWKAIETADEAAALEAVGVDAVTADRWDVAPAAPSSTPPAQQARTEPAP
jgi:glycerophosphoryl diester phosphodiesterase